MTNYESLFETILKPKVGRASIGGIAVSIARVGYRIVDMKIGGECTYRYNKRFAQDFADFFQKLADSLEE